VHVNYPTLFDPTTGQPFANNQIPGSKIDPVATKLMNLFPAVYVLHWVPPIAGVWLPLAWAYTFTKVSEDARLATARLAVGTR